MEKLARLAAARKAGVAEARKRIAPVLAKLESLELRVDGMSGVAKLSVSNDTLNLVEQAREFRIALESRLKELAESANGDVTYLSTLGHKYLDSGEFQRHLGEQAATEALNRDDISGVEMQEISLDLETFSNALTEIIRSDDRCDKKTVLSAIESALFIGYASGMPSEKVAQLRAEAERKRSEFQTEQAALARKARAASPANTALMRAITKLRGSSYPNRPSKEAAAILDAVNSEVDPEFGTSR